MSFILDALKKSESERQRQSGPALLEMRIAPPPRALPAWAMVVGALLIVSVAVLAWMALHPTVQRATGASVYPPSAGAGAGAMSGPAAPGGPAAAGAPAASAPVAAGNSGTGAAAYSAPAADNAAAPGDGAAANAVETGDAPVNPADTAPAIAPGPDAAPAALARGNLRSYAEISGTVPELRLDLHVYAPSPAERYAFINMRRVREGDVTPEGVQVRQITREGVVLEYHGAEFLLGRQ
jgi:general secretion pathway protein B